MNPATKKQISRKIHYFRDDDGDRVVVVTELLPNGEYGAWVEGVDLDGPHGLGGTMMEAIADLYGNLFEDDNG